MVSAAAEAAPAESIMEVILLLKPSIFDSRIEAALAPSDEENISDRDFPVDCAYSSISLRTSVTSYPIAEISENFLPAISVPAVAACIAFSAVDPEAPSSFIMALR